LRLLYFIAFLLVAFPTLFIAQRMSSAWRAGTIRGLYKILCFGLGFKLRVYGAPVTNRPCLYVSNHLSYLDIPLLGSLLQASFVSRADVENWPLIGYLGKLQNTVWIDRRPELAVQHAKELRRRIEIGDRILVFPEGTSTDGLHLLPFKSTLFEVAAPIKNTDGTETQVTVQPISIIVTEMGNLPIGRHQRPLYSWYGDMTFEHHFWDVLQRAGFTLEVQFHAPVTMAQFGNRKKLAAHCEKVVAEGVSAGLAGRLGQHANPVDMEGVMVDKPLALLTADDVQRN
jgi:1-acyl-sn-glycerol-3-phosphate acyltransferase